MTSLASLAARYRWELLLVIGIPLAVDVVAGLIALRPDMFGLLAPWRGPSLTDSFFVLLLGLSYLRVRLLGRRTLSLVWAYALTAVAAAGVAKWVVIELFMRDYLTFLLLAALPMLATLPFLGWFGRQASKMSLSHALLLVGMSLFVTKHFIPIYIILAIDFLLRHSLYHVNVWLVSLALAGVLSPLTIRALRRFDSADSGDRRRMVLLLTAGSLLYGLFTTSHTFLPNSVVIMDSLKISRISAMYVAAYYVAAFGLVWLLRARGERDREPIA